MINLDFSKVKKDYLALISVILIAVIGFFAYSKIFGPLFNKIKTTASQIEQKRAEAERAKISPDALRQLEKEMDELKREVNFYQDKLNADIDVPQILKELNQLGEQLGVKFVSVRPLSRSEIPLPGDGQALVQIPIQLRIKCGYHQLGIFINQIENSPRLMKISELKVSADSSNVFVHEAELVIVNYMLTSK